MNDTAPTNETTGLHQVVGWFGTLEQVRQVEIDLERHGIDAVTIAAMPIDSVPHRRSIDRRTFSWLSRRAAVGAALGLVAGALIGLAIGASLGHTGVDLGAWVLAGAVFGVAPGCFYAVATRLPAEPATFDTFADDEVGNIWIAVTGDDETLATARDVLTAHNPTWVNELDRIA